MKEQGITVGWRFRRHVRSYDAARAGTVVDDKLLLQRCAKFLCNESRRDIRAAGGEWHDHTYGPRWIRFCGRSGELGHRIRQYQSEDAEENAHAACHGPARVVPSVLADSSFSILRIRSAIDRERIGDIENPVFAINFSTIASAGAGSSGRM